MSRKAVKRYQKNKYNKGNELRIHAMTLWVHSLMHEKVMDITHSSQGSINLCRLTGPKT